MYLGLIVGVLIVGLIVAHAHKEQKRKEKDAAFQAELMMAAARAKTEAKRKGEIPLDSKERWKIPFDKTQGDVYYAPETGQILLNCKSTHETLFGIQPFSFKHNYLLELGYIKLGRL